MTRLLCSSLGVFFFNSFFFKQWLSRSGVPLSSLQSFSIRRFFFSFFDSSLKFEFLANVFNGASVGLLLSVGSHGHLEVIDSCIWAARFFGVTFTFRIKGMAWLVFRPISTTILIDYLARRKSSLNRCIDRWWCQCLTRHTFSHGCCLDVHGIRLR